MKSLLKITMVLALCSAVFAGCNDDGYDLGNRVYDYGTVVATDMGPTNNYQVSLDNGLQLYIYATHIPNVTVSNNDRVFVNFTILEDVLEAGKLKGYKVRMNGLYKLLSKPAVKQSAIDEDPTLDDKLGHDPMRVTRAKFSGKYLNMDFDFPGSNNPAERHFINIVFDNVNVVEGKAVLTMRHNAYGDKPTGYHKGFVSFDISEIAPQDGQSIEVTLKWIEYVNGWIETEEKQLLGTFTSKNSDNASKSTYEIGKNSFIE